MAEGLRLGRLELFLSTKAESKLRFFQWYIMIMHIAYMFSLKKTYK